ncbi:unnamed protein product [Phytophthora lilii]|uniref:Unnamed protein product n=1 Tax=Phytophthora lilii TaxID=2077276 RepID=A0A9W6WZM3_9STRA|nr:unnamed protein product [Phytophthora lilii]
MDRRSLSARATARPASSAAQENQEPVGVRITSKALESAAPAPAKAKHSGPSASVSRKHRRALHSIDSNRPRPVSHSAVAAPKRPLSNAPSRALTDPLEATKSGGQATTSIQNATEANKAAESMLSGHKRPATTTELELKTPGELGDHTEQESENWAWTDMILALLEKRYGSKSALPVCLTDLEAANMFKLPQRKKIKTGIASAPEAAKSRSSLDATRTSAAPQTSSGVGTKNCKMPAPSSTNSQQIPARSDREQEPAKEDKRQRLLLRHAQQIQASSVSSSTSCGCKTGCLKMYCMCFSSRGFCHAGCACEDCKNGRKNKTERVEAIQNYLANDPRAFSFASLPQTASTSGFLHLLPQPSGEEAQTHVPRAQGLSSFNSQLSGGVDSKLADAVALQEEEKALRDEVSRLEAQVAGLMTQGMTASEVAAAGRPVQQIQLESKVLADSLRGQQLGLAAAQALTVAVAIEQSTQYSHPLWSRICLKKMWSDRRATLLAIREEKLLNAYKYLMERNFSTVDGADRETVEKFESDNGDICCLGNAIIHFPGVQSLQQVFDALCFYLNNMEISISERLGHLTVREDYDVIEGSAYNSRIVLIDDNGISTELNSIGFTQFFDKGDPRLDGEPCALAVSNCVDEDELNPYRPNEYVRKDITGAILLTASKRRKRDAADNEASTDDEELVVTMRRSGMLKLHRPEFSMTPFVQQELEAGIADWATRSWSPLTPPKTDAFVPAQEEEKALKEEILQLQAQVAVLKTKGRPAGPAIAADPGLQQSAATWKVLHDLVKGQQLGVAQAQSLVMECAVSRILCLSCTLLLRIDDEFCCWEQRTQFSHPLCTRICLKQDWAGRRETLLAIREEKLRNAYEYVMARSQYGAEGPGQESNEQFETDDGDICFVGNTVVHFPGVTLQQVFEALYFYLTNMEISISERLGHITVREDYDVIEGSAYNSRIVSNDNNGISTESNTIVFTQLIEKDDPRFGGEACAVVASDCVNEDELYPYRPSEHIRKDISGAVVLTAGREKKRSPIEREEGTDSADDDGEQVVTMRRTGFLKLHRPEFPVSPLAQQELETGIADWGQEEEKALRDEILQLEAQVAVLNTQGMPRASALAADPALQQAKTKHKMIADAAKKQQLGVAAAHSLLVECTVRGIL